MQTTGTHVFYRISFPEKNLNYLHNLFLYLKYMVQEHWTVNIQPSQMEVIFYSKVVLFWHPILNVDLTDSIGRKSWGQNYRQDICLRYILDLLVNYNFLNGC